MEQKDFIEAFACRGLDALERKEPFEAYIYLWLAFLQSCSPETSKKITSDRKHIIIPWNKKNYNKVYKLLKNKKIKDNLVWLSKRENGFILRKKNRSERDIVLLQKFSAFIESGFIDRNFSKKNISEGILILCLSVRNNLFHGGKSFYDENDNEILRQLCPILIQLLYLNHPTLSTKNGT